MTRPIYETAHDRQRQHAAARVFGQKLKAQMVATPPQTRHDYDAFREGRLVGQVEVKCRTNPMSKYPTYAISADKVDALLALGRPVAIVVQWSDVLGWCRLKDETHRTMGGRWDRGDPADREMVAHYPISVFRVLKSSRRTGTGTSSP